MKRVTHYVELDILEEPAHLFPYLFLNESFLSPLDLTHPAILRTIKDPPEVQFSVEVLVNLLKTY